MVEETGQGPFVTGRTDGHRQGRCRDSSEVSSCRVGRGRAGSRPGPFTFHGDREWRETLEVERPEVPKREATPTAEEAEEEE